jgi:hypothetical protein
MLPEMEKAMSQNNPVDPSYLTNVVGAGSYIARPYYIARRLRCQCGKDVEYQRIATETAAAKNVTGLMILAEKEAAVCPDCGVIAWVR